MPRALLLLPLAASLWAAGARADEKEWIFAIQPAAAVMHVNGATTWGGGGGLDLSYGITDALAVRVTGAVSGHLLAATKDDPGGPLLAYHAGAGLTYVVDVIRLVPYAEFSLGVLGTARELNGTWTSSNKFGIELGLGADYVINRRVSVGLVVRYHAYLTALQDIPIYVYFGPRIAIHFGG
jgi:hypothetical protein